MELTKLRSTLSLVEGQTVQVLQAGVSGAEVIERKLAIEDLELAGDFQRAAKIADQALSVISLVRQSSGKPAFAAMSAICAGKSERRS